VVGVTISVRSELMVALLLLLLLVMISGLLMILMVRLRSGSEVVPPLLRFARPDSERRLK
jgi:hypothetical protein